MQDKPQTQPHVTLVGAGPGDPDLLTVKAVKAIGSATVLLVDDLVSDAIPENELFELGQCCTRNKR